MTDEQPVVPAPATEHSILAGANLPKWPQCIIVGKPVTAEQAFDIILRTDSFLSDVLGHSGGNARRFNAHYQAMLVEGTGLDAQNLEWQDAWAAKQEVRRALGYVDLAYVYNRWASSAYIFGPAGFVSPEGRVYFAENLGKWPEAADVFEDLCKVAGAWPFLDFRATLYSAEQCEERTPVISFAVAGGQATVIPTVDLREVQPVVYDEQGAVVDEFAVKLDEHARKIGAGYPENRELGLPTEWYARAAARVNEVIRTLMSPRLG